MELFYQFNDNDFIFDVDWYDLKKAVEHLLKKQAKVKDNENLPVERLMQYIMKDLDDCVIQALAEAMEEELTEYFYEVASEKYIDNLAMKAEEEREWREYEQTKYSKN